ncbi:MAG: translation initiation factor IF-2 associated domain-containing protein, partial [Ensifer adhaerens]
MSDTKSGDDKTLSVTPKKTLTLKRPGTEQSVVRQNFSHGRTKQVQVEIKKRKFSMPGDKPEPVAAPVLTPKPAVVAAPVVQEAPKAPPPPPPVERSGMVLNELSRGEMEARRRALEGSKVREVEDRQRAAEDAKRRAEDEERR